jgi:hypothetical protein
MVTANWANKLRLTPSSLRDSRELVMPGAGETNTIPVSLFPGVACFERAKLLPHRSDALKRAPIRADGGA